MMKRSELFVFVSQLVKNKIESVDFMHKSRSSEKDFTRTSKLGFVNTISIMLNFFTKSINIELRNFFKNVAETKETVKRQSFDTARRKISYEAVKELFDSTVTAAFLPEDAKLFRGYRVFGIDGSTLKLENSEELKNAYGLKAPALDQVFARISALYEITNDFIFDAAIEPYDVSEHVMAKKHVEKLISFTDEKNNIVALDRGYWSPSLLAQIENSGNKFIVRLRKNVSSFVTKNIFNEGFFEMKENDKVYKFRFLKLTLPSGEKELLATNLTHGELEDGLLSKLYFMRWGIETKYNELKSKLKLESFSGKSVLIVKQDFYATLFLSNMVAFATYASDEIIDEKQGTPENPTNPKRKHKHKSNRNIAISELRNDFIKILMITNVEKMQFELNNLLQSIARDSVPIRPNRHFGRKAESLKNKPHNNTKYPL